MSIDAYLTSHQLYDCNGRITHTLTLLVDGTVRVSATNGSEVLADPRTHTCLTRGGSITDGVWAAIEAISV